jgi:hypothetical protein
MAEITLKDALLREGTFVLAPEEAASDPRLLKDALAKVVGGAPIKANIVPRLITGRMRKGDLIVVASAVFEGDADSGAVKYELRGPHNVSDTWSPKAKMGAGDIEPKSFFNALAALAHPMVCARRAETENDFFQLRHA